jgi:hypothetical protein
MKIKHHLSGFFLLLLWLAPMTATMAVTVSSIVPLNYRMVDAEYSKSLNKIISVSVNPARLHSYDPVTNTVSYVDLPLAPSSVSISPDGLFAAVGHNTRISYVDLKTVALLKTVSVTTDVLDVVLAGNGFAYAFPRADQWVNIHSVNLNTGQETLGSGIRAGTLAKLHPNGKAIYGANNGLSPDNIEKYGIDNSGNATIFSQSPYWGNFAMCGNLWLSEDGLSIFTACGNVFKSSSVKAEDMLYNGKFSNTNSVKFAAHSQKASQVVVIPGTNDTTVQIYDANYFSLQDSKTLPNFSVNAQNYLAHGRFVFYNADSTKFFAVVQADSASGLVNDFGIVSYSSGVACDALAPESDCDSDGIVNKNDDCILVANKPRGGRLTQLDSDGDHYGNVCDPDLNNDNVVDGRDFSQWLGNTVETSAWLSKCRGLLYSQPSDFNGDCKVDKLDANVIIQFLFKKPGPSCIDLPANLRGSGC